MSEAVAADPAETPPLDRRRAGAHALGIGLSVLATLIGLIFLAWAILFITKGRFLKPHFERYVSKQAQRDVRVAGDFQLYLNPIDIKFLAENMTISNPAWATRKNFFDSRLIDTNISTFPLIFGDRRVNWLNLIDGNVDLEWDKSGKRNTWTMGDPNKPAEPFELPLIRRASIVGTDVRYRMPSLQLNADIKVETVRAKDTAFDSDIRFSGGGTLRDESFTLTGSLMSPNETVRGGRNKLAFHAEARSTKLDIAGTLVGPTQFEGADLKMLIRGYNFANAMALLGVTTPATRAYRFSSNLTKSGPEWRFTGLTGYFGESDLAGRMIISMPNNRLFVDADLRSKVVDIVDIGPFMGYDARRLDARKTIVTIEGGRPRVLPDASLQIEAIKLFDAHVDYTVSRIRADSFPISNVGLTVDLDRSLLKLSPLTFDMAGGHVASDIVIDARPAVVVTDYDIRLSPTPMGTLLARWGTEKSGTTGTIKARIELRGEGDSVRKSLASSDGRIAFIMPKGTFWTRNVQLIEIDIGTFVQKMFEKKLEKPVQINCGLIAFTVRDGIAAADPILIDTSKNVIAGRGGFSFKTERLDLAVKADAKTISLFSGQSPVGIGGYFAAPKIDPISGQLLTRAGIGIGLGLVASPLAAILAFVDTGDADDTQCGPVLGGARASAQRDKDGDRVKGLGTGKTADPDAKPKKKKKFLGIF